jgi:hypothetical protein
MEMQSAEYLHPHLHNSGIHNCMRGYDATCAKTKCPANNLQAGDIVNASAVLQLPSRIVIGGVHCFCGARRVRRESNYFYICVRNTCSNECHPRHCAPRAAAAAAPMHVEALQVHPTGTERFELLIRSRNSLPPSDSVWN